MAGVIRDSAGNLYGTTCGGGLLGFGVVYELDMTGRYTVRYRFRGGVDGACPYAGVTRDSAGNLYGTAAGGAPSSACGNEGCGVVYKLDVSRQYTVLHRFMGRNDGAFPEAGVICRISRQPVWNNGRWTRTRRADAGSLQARCNRQVHGASPIYGSQHWQRAQPSDGRPKW